MSQTTPSVPEPDPAQRPARLALYLGGALVLVGGIVMYFGYDGAAKSAVPQAQTPYVISGGLLGLALMVLGGIGLAVHVLLQVQADFRTELNAMRENIEVLADALSHQVFGTGSTAKAPSSNGTVMVAQGATSFHRPDCRLVTAAQHVRPLPREEADRTGLIPCRVCKP